MTSAAGADGRGDARGTGDSPGLQVDAEAVLGEVALRSGRRLDLDAGAQAGLFHRFQELAGSVSGIAVDRRLCLARRAVTVLTGAEQVIEQAGSRLGVPAVTRRDGGGGDDLRVRVDRDVPLQCRASSNAA